MANRFADEIIQYFTGERGPFDSQIAFLSTRGGRFKDVYVMSANGEDVRRDHQREHAQPLAVVDAGRRARWCSPRIAAAIPDLFSIALPRGTWTKLSSLRGLNLGGHWSPDGRRLAVTLEYDGNPEIALLNADGSLLRRLTDHWAVDVSPSWSPDGEQLAFCSDRSGAPQIYVMSADGGGVRRVSTIGQLQHVAELVAEGRSHRLRVARRRPLSDLHREDRRHRRAAGDQRRRQQRGPELVARRALSRLQLDAARRVEALPDRCRRRESSLN